MVRNSIVQKVLRAEATLWHFVKNKAFVWKNDLFTRPNCPRPIPRLLIRRPRLRRLAICLSRDRGWGFSGSQDRLETETSRPRPHPWTACSLWEILLQQPNFQEDLWVIQPNWQCPWTNFGQTKEDNDEDEKKQKTRSNGRLQTFTITAELFTGTFHQCPHTTMAVMRSVNNSSIQQLTVSTHTYQPY